LSHRLQARYYSTSVFLRAGGGASVGDGKGKKTSVRATPAPAGSSTTRIFFVQRQGAKGSAKLVTRAADEGDLVKEIKKELELAAPLDSITLQLATEDGTLFTAKDVDGTEQPVTLNSMDTVDEALEKAATAAGRAIKPGDKLRIIVDVSAPALPTAAPAAAAVGECGGSAIAQLVHSENAGSGPAPAVACQLLLPRLLPL
jgi:hypothetical protein